MKKLFLSMAIVGLGTFAMAQQADSPTNMRNGKNPQSMQMRGQKQMDRMKQELNLNDDQVMKIKALHEKNKANNKANKQESRKNMDNEMKNILTPDQYTKWKDNMKARKQNMKGKKMKMRKDGAAMMQSQTN